MYITEPISLHRFTQLDCNRWNETNKEKAPVNPLRSSESRLCITYCSRSLWRALLHPRALTDVANVAWVWNSSQSHRGGLLWNIHSFRVQQRLTSYRSNGRERFRCSLIHKIWAIDSSHETRGRPASLRVTMLLTIREGRLSFQPPREKIQKTEPFLGMQFGGLFNSR